MATETATGAPALNPPKQTRSRKTLERIVAASLEILDREGPEGLTVHAVVEQAESSVGSFYARFKGKDDLLDYLGERVWNEALERWNAVLAERAWTEVTLVELVEASVGLLIDAQRSRSSYLSSIDRASGGGDGYASFRRHVLAGLGDLLLARQSEMRHEDPEVAVALGLRALLGVIDAQDGGQGTSRDAAPLSRDALIRECRLLLLGYLVGDAGIEGDERVDFFDVWG